MKSAMYLRTCFVVAILTGLAFVMCARPTQIKVRVFTEVPCGNRSPSVAFYGANSSDGVRQASIGPTKTDACVPAGVSGEVEVGTIVLSPKDSTSGRVEFEVVTETTGEDPSVCRVDGKNCIVSRRALNYAENQTSTLEVHLRLSCKGVTCDSATGALLTCVKGTCAPAEVPPSCIGADCTEEPWDLDAGIDAGIDAGVEPQADTGPMPAPGFPDAGPFLCYPSDASIPCVGGAGTTTQVLGHRRDARCSITVPRCDDQGRPYVCSYGSEICGNGIDDDCNGLKDDVDGGCAGASTLYNERACFGCGFSAVWSYSTETGVPNVSYTTMQADPACVSNTYCKQGAFVTAKLDGPQQVDPTLQNITCRKYCDFIGMKCSNACGHREPNPRGMCLGMDAGPLGYAQLESDGCWAEGSCDTVVPQYLFGNAYNARCCCEFR